MNGRFVRASIIVVALNLSACTAGTTRAPSPSIPSAAPSHSRTTAPPATAESSDATQPYCGDQNPCVPASLRRPLTIPTIAAGAPCPYSRVIVHPAGTPVARGAGSGPVYAGPYGPMDAFPFDLPPSPNQPDFAGSTWGGEKVLWHAGPSYRGPVLIRGRQLDGGHLVRFERGEVPSAELMFPAQPGNGWRDWPSYTRVEAPGCYGWQVDGTNFTEVIVFRAVDATP